MAGSIDRAGAARYAHQLAVEVEEQTRKEAAESGMAVDPILTASAAKLRKGLEVRQAHAAAIRQIRCPSPPDPKPYTCSRATPYVRPPSFRSKPIAGVQASPGSLPEPQTLDESGSLLPLNLELLAAASL